LYVITSTECGGAEKALHALALAARQAGHTVSIVSIRPLGTVARALQADDFNVRSLNLKSKFNLVQTAQALAQLIDLIQETKPDVVHGFLYRGIEFCRRAKKRIPFRLVTTPHYDLSKKNFFMRLVDRGLKDADDISCAESEQTAQFLIQKQHYAKEKVRLVCNGVDRNYFRPPTDAERQAARKQLGFTEKNTVFCCVARLSAEKNHLVLLQSFAALYAKNPAARLVLVGDGPEKSVLEAFLAKNGLKRAILLVGEVKDVRPYLWAADVFVLPSAVESLPLALLEAGSCGLPAVVSRAGDMPRVVAHGQTGFVCNGGDALVQTVLMAELLSNGKLREQMGKNARTRTETFFPPAEPIYLEIYENLK